MLNITPDAYIHVRMMNGISCARSGVLLPSRAMTIARPVLKTNWSASAGMTSSHDQVGDLPEAEQDHHQHAHREQQLLELHQAERDGQAGAREVQRPDQAQVARDRPGARP